MMRVQSSQQVSDNHLRLKTSIETVRWLAKQACAFRGHDESGSSSNRGNFLEMILDNKVRKKVGEEIGSAKFCILVDEALDESNQEQMAIILRFVDCHGIIRERFFHVVSVHDTTALTLKENITSILTRYDLQIENMRGQGYDGASNIRGPWNGLQALPLNECLSAYYVHSFAHQLQLALVEASKDVHDEWLFFSKLNSVVNFVNVSPKFHSKLRSAREDEITNRLIRLVLTLPDSTATTERAFPAMKLIKTSLRNKMDDNFLLSCMVIYIERELADSIDSDAPIL
ncbi:hypothetical protein PTKIN_Ptkin10aG0064200 [Pterospermum kingtungense]